MKMTSTISTSDLVLRTHRIPTGIFHYDGANDQSPLVVNNLRFMLANVGWTLSPDLGFYLETLSKKNVVNYANLIYSFANEMSKGHVRYMPLFVNFPNVNYTNNHWYDLYKNLLKAKNTGVAPMAVEEFEKNVESNIAVFTANFKTLNLGDSLESEIKRYSQILLESSIPLSETDMSFLELMMTNISLDFEPNIKVKEILAIWNYHKVSKGLSGKFPTLTDILRFAVKVSGGDVTLATKTKFKNFKRKYRREVFEAINRLSVDNPGFIVDCHMHGEVWKRLGEKLHPHESKYESVKKLFMEIRGETQDFPSLNSRQEKAFTGSKKDIIEFYSKYPSLLGRNLDRVLRTYEDIEVKDLKKIFESFSSKVIISAIQRLENRDADLDLYVTKGGKIWLDKNREVKSISASKIKATVQALKQELSNRSEGYSNVILSQELEEVAVPLTDKLKPKGIGVYPIGSITKIDNANTDLIRFFIYWHQSSVRTDYDLSCLFLDKDYKEIGQVSYTNLSALGAKHSGDFTSAPDGASEFIDLPLKNVPKNVKYVLPQVNKFAGESFDEVKEVFFGYMERNVNDNGNLFEPKSVKIKSEITGTSQVVYPVVFVRDGDSFYSKWIHLNLNSRSFVGTVERNSATSSDLVKSIVEKKYFTVKDLVECHKSAKTKTVDNIKQLLVIGTGVDIPKDTTDKYVTPLFLQDLIPE